MSVRIDIWDINDGMNNVFLTADISPQTIQEVLEDFLDTVGDSIADDLAERAANRLQKFLKGKVPGIIKRGHPESAVQLWQLDLPSGNIVSDMKDLGAQSVRAEHLVQMRPELRRALEEAAMMQEPGVVPKEDLYAEPEETMLSQRRRHFTGDPRDLEIQRTGARERIQRLRDTGVYEKPSYIERMVEPPPRVEPSEGLLAREPGGEWGFIEAGEERPMLRRIEIPQYIERPPLRQIETQRRIERPETGIVRY